MENSTKNKSSIAFIVELFMMFAILLTVIVVITEVLVMTRSESLSARHLTEAVTCAESAAEVITASDSKDDALELLGSMDNATSVKREDEGYDLKMSYKSKSTSGDVYDLKITEETETAGTGTYTVSTIVVTLEGADEPIYTLRTGAYRKGAE